jgi:hypothetical protein
MATEGPEGSTMPAVRADDPLGKLIEELGLAFDALQHSGGLLRWTASDMLDTALKARRVLQSGMSLGVDTVPIELDLERVLLDTARRLGVLPAPSEGE